MTSITYKLHHFGLLCADTTASARFYRDVLRLDELARFYKEGAYDLTFLSGGSSLLLELVGAPFSAGEQAFIERRGHALHHIAFETADLVEWTAQNVAPNMVYHTNGGVLEYLSAQSVERYFQIIKEQAPNSLVYLNEPVYGDFDVTKDLSSRIIGDERSYSHNYAHMLETAGFKILRHEERVSFDHRLILVIAES